MSILVFIRSMLLFLNKLDVNLRWMINYVYKVYILGIKTPVQESLEVIHMSPNFLVVNKQCDVVINSNNSLVHPVTVATQLSYKFPHLCDSSIMHGFRFCHRLDYSTSGILCLALSKDAARHFSIALQSRGAEKHYVALVYGHVTDEYLVIKKAIGIDTRPQFSHRMCTSEKEYCGSPRWAVSKLLVLQRGLYNNYPATKVLLKLLTGRRHQLRVHCHEIGHTIIGDYTYSNRRDLAPYRMFLHAFRFVLHTGIETINVCTKDPFTEEDKRNKWTPIETVNSLNNETFIKISGCE